MTRRNFSVRHLDDGAILITAGGQMTRLSEAEIAELADVIAAPVIAREVARVTGLEV